MAGLCEGGNEPSGSLKANDRQRCELVPRCTGQRARVQPRSQVKNPGRRCVASRNRAGRGSVTGEAPHTRLATGGTDVFCKEETVWKVMCVLVGHKQFELNARSKKLATLVRANRSQSHSVPRILSQDKRDDRMTICGDLISSADDDPTFLNRIITGDETWRFLYDPQLKRQSATWKTPLSPRQKKPRQDRSKGKVMLELFFDSNGIVNMEFIPEGATVNKTRYKEILGRL
ncbi:hypothetical protein ANN_12082 [Periplaneta americana]|uniref:Uncharacterized protein n=1 Tax=Periplaneta americana TaxID=6978 RepID=A0ABQ8T8D1_PERAM|nr:hypothetical protein ANN_12082 [Periplaneta americana]